MYDVNATRQRNGIRNRIYVDAMPASGQTVVHTGGFATLDRQIVVDSYITATAFVRELRILAGRFPSLMPERGAHASSGRPFRRSRKPWRWTE
jgi:hypothetical protein